jgi:hypothetical protein
MLQPFLSSAWLKSEGAELTFCCVLLLLCRRSACAAAVVSGFLLKAVLDVVLSYIYSRKLFVVESGLVIGLKELDVN